MKRYSRNEIVLVRYPFTDQSGAKIRPAVVIGPSHPSDDIIVVALTSRLRHLFPGEFVLTDWQGAGLNVPTAVKRGIMTISSALVICAVGSLSADDANRLKSSVLGWIA